MKSLLIAVAATTCLLATGAASAQEALAKAGGCLNCHAVDAKKIGPSFKEVAAKHKGKADAEAALIAKITAGKDHPEVKAKPEDVQKIVKWVLAM